MQWGGWPGRCVVGQTAEVGAGGCWAQGWQLLWGLTYKVLLGVIPEVEQALGDGLAVLLPLARAEDHLREVPHPANDGHVGQLLLGQHFGALKQRKVPDVCDRAVGPLWQLLEISLENGVNIWSKGLRGQSRTQ